METQAQLAEVGGGGGSRVPVGSGQQCVVLGALTVLQLPFTAQTRFLKLSIPSAKVKLRFSPPPKTQILHPMSGLRGEVPGSAVMEARKVCTTSLRSQSVDTPKAKPGVARQQREQNHCLRGPGTDPGSQQLLEPS